MVKSAASEEQLFQEMTVEGVGGLVNVKSGKMLDTVSFFRLVDVKEILEIFGVKLSDEDLGMIDSL